MDKKNTRKKENLAPERGEKFVFLCLPPSSYDLNQSCRVVAHGTRDSYKEPPLPFWCSVRFPLNPLEFNDVLPLLFSSIKPISFYRNQNILMLVAKCQIPKRSPSSSFQLSPAQYRLQVLLRCSSVLKVSSFPPRQRGVQQSNRAISVAICMRGAILHLCGEY